jgi:hypothetical protein
MQQDQKQLKQAYQLERRPMGVFQIRNLSNEKIFVAAGLELQGLINRHRFELEKGGHRNSELQSDWNELGSQGFAFEILDQMLPESDSRRDPRRELASLKSLWLEKLKPYGDRGYNERELKREERLQQMAARRREP